MLKQKLAKVWSILGEFKIKSTQIKCYHYYSNGQYGNNWSVRQIIGESKTVAPNEDKVTYRVITGKGRRKQASCTRTEFAEWAVYEVFRNENSWQRIV